jgi:hypothetical protein
MRQQKRHIALTLDNFEGHTVNYEPTNIEIFFFELNLTPFVQPCDTGIIRTFKAKYRRAFCARTIDFDEAGELNIYNIDILEAMLMAKRAWAEVTPETITHCWRHTKITAP